MKKFYQMTATECLESVKSNVEGITEKEATKRLQISGENILKEKGKRTPLKIFLSQFANMMIILLILVGIVSLVYSLVTHESVIEAVVIFSCVLVNALMGFSQEMKSENVIESLKDLTQSKVKVKRDGEWVTVDAKEIVVGDIILVEAGDKIPADARILQMVNAKVDESILTGESVAVDKITDPITKNVLLQERKNMIYSGTTIVGGKIQAVVVSTGMDTEIGGIAGSLNTKDEALTPLQVKVKKVSSFITVIACFLIAIALCYGLLKGLDAISIIMLCISMVLASVPEVLPVSITATLTIGVQQMSKRKTIVKQLSAIETLGATQIICTDKTGTLTTNEMTVVEIFANHKTYKNINIAPKELQKLYTIFALCNDTKVDGKHKGEYIGDPVEIALSKYLDKLGMSSIKMKEQYVRVGEIPFDSTRKMMSTIHDIDGECLMLTKGSLGALLEKSTQYLQNGKIVPITKAMKNKLFAQEKQMSKKSYKVLAFAYKPIDKKSSYDVEEEKDLIMVGIAGMIDPPKDGVQQAVKKCIEAKMKPIMITGDSLATGLAIAKEVGIAISDEEGIEGKVIDNLTDEELNSFVKKYTVFARVTPEHKVRIVRAFQSTGKVVAMTGDGVNDAPALKLAHVGIGMGKAGTDVTKSVADIILMDDSFSTIVTAVEQGRRIYHNVLRTILYNLSSNFAEIFLILFGMILGVDIITALHILYIDIVADTLPSIALAFEKDDKDSMKQKPHGLNRPIFTPFMTASIVVSAIIEALISLGIFFVARQYFGLAVAQTLALLSVVLTEFTFTYNCKELKKPIFKKGVFGNKYINYSILLLFVIQILVFFTPIGSVFGLVSITIWQFLVVLGINIIGFFIIEIIKPLLAKYCKDE